MNLVILQNRLSSSYQEPCVTGILTLQVIPSLIEDFFVVVVSYTGFDMKGRSDYTSVLAEVEKIEVHIKYSY